MRRRRRGRRMKMNMKLDNKWHVAFNQKIQIPGKWSFIIYSFDGGWYRHDFQKYVFIVHLIICKNCCWEVHQKHWKSHYLDLFSPISHGCHWAVREWGLVLGRNMPAVKDHKWLNPVFVHYPYHLQRGCLEIREAKQKAAAWLCNLCDFVWEKTGCLGVWMPI